MRILLLGVLLCGGCKSLPEPSDQRNLYIDLRQVVETRERGEWLLDEKELEEARPKAMQSVCRVTTQATASLDEWLAARVNDHGGPAARQYAQGVGLDDLGEVLTLERIRKLARFSERARPRCPFWLQPSDNYAGVHRPTDRFVLLAESAGAGSLIIQGDETLLGAGGAGRLLPAWGLGHRYLFALGGELGGAAGLEPLTDTDDKIETRVHAAVPLMLRVFDLTHIYDLELAATALASPRDFDPSYGVRAQFGAGLLTVRISRFLPYFSLTAGYEVLPWEEPAIHILRIGTRFGVDFDPSPNAP